MRRLKLTTWVLLLLMVSGLTSLTSAQSSIGTIITNNTGDTSTSWYIDGEPTLIINGFDLNAIGLETPIFIQAVRLSVIQPVPGVPIDVVIYEDPNGGSPVDATLVTRFTTTIDNPGVARAVLPEPVAINAPVVWVGFYLPVDFRFRADRSGTSVLTYWGWSPATTFDLANLGSAAIFGPGDGSEPVNINMNGVARLTFELFDPQDSPEVFQRIAPIGLQLEAPETAVLSRLLTYPYCGETVFFDPDDMAISANNRFTLFCRTDIPQDSTGVIRNINQFETGVVTLDRRSRLYDITGGGNYLRDPSTSNTKLAVPVTHCIRPEQADLNSAIIGIAYGAPQQWEVLPSVRYGELVCAEVTHIGLLAYFTPRVGEQERLNANLYFVGTQRFVSLEDTRFSPICRRLAYLIYNIRNEGFQATPETTVQFQIFSTRTGQPIGEGSIPLPSIVPGSTITIQKELNAPNVFVNETHRIVLRIDPNNLVAESNDADNETSFEYLLRGPC